VKRNKYIIKNGTDYSRKNIKLQFSHTSDLHRVELVRDTLQKNLDILCLPQHGSKISAVVPFNSGGSGHFVTTVNSQLSDQDTIVFQKSDGPIGQILLDFDYISPTNVTRIFPVKKEQGYLDNHIKVFELSSKIRDKIEINEDKLFLYVHELSHLLTEFHSIIVREVEAYKKFCELVFNNGAKNNIVDLRSYIRRVSHFLFKYLPDFSGSEEEEAGLTQFRVKPFLFKFKFIKSCITIQNPYLQRLIPLLNQRKVA